MRVLVCGGRNFDDEALMDEVLNNFHYDKPITHIINGGAKGADALARNWASFRRITCTTFRPDWSTHGNKAGPIRNSMMLAIGKPDMVIAFPGGAGTDDMRKKAKAAGVQVVEIHDT